MILIGGIICGVGLLLLLAGMAMAGGALSIPGRRILKTGLPFGKDVEAGPARVDGASPCRLLVALTVGSTAVEEEEWFGRMRHKVKFSFPFKAEVVDSGGSPVYATDEPVSWESGSRSWTGKETAEGGKIKTQIGLDSFTPPAAGDLRVKVRIDEDAEFGAQAGPAKLFLLDRAEESPNFLKSLFRGMIFTVLGPLLILVGVIVALIGLIF